MIYKAKAKNQRAAHTHKQKNVSRNLSRRMEGTTATVSLAPEKQQPKTILT